MEMVEYFSSTLYSSIKIEGGGGKRVISCASAKVFQVFQSLSKFSRVFPRITKNVFSIDSSSSFY